MGLFALILALTLPVAEVTGERDTGTRRYPGRIVPVAQVNVVPQVSGEILEVGFSNGQSVRKGDILYRLDSVKYEAAVKNAEAKVSELKAQNAYAALSAQRYEQLVLTRAVSQDDLDHARTTRESSQAALAAAEAALEAADRRYRAVMMTAWSFLLGVLPLVFASGAGCRAQQAMGLTTMSGMVAATFVGLVFVPALYVFFAGRTPLSKGGQS